MGPADGPALMSELRLHSCALTDIGLVRSTNQDGFVERPEVGLWGVADGMGGHEAGDYASKSVVDALNAAKRMGDLEDFVDEVKKQLSITDHQLRLLAKRLGPDAVVASTVVALLIWGGDFAGIWVGDSRLYQWRDGELRRLSSDHSRVQELVNAGLLAPEAAPFHPEAHVVTQAIGAGKQAFGTRVGTVAAGDRFLLCSDGLTNMVSDGEIAAEFADKLSPQAVAASLRDLVLARGAVDNFTIVVVAADPV